MKNKMFLFALAILLFPFVSSIPITNCTAISVDGYYNLMNNIETDISTCLYINSSNVIIDGNYFTIYSNANHEAISNVFGGVAVQDLTNVSIKNFKIDGGGLISSIELEHINDTLVENIDFKDSNSIGIEITTLNRNLKNVVIRNITADNIHLPIWVRNDEQGAYMSNVSIYNVRASNIDGTGILIDVVDNVFIDDVTIDNVREGIFPYNVRNLSVENVNIRHTERCIKIEDGTNYSFKNINLFDCTEYYFNYFVPPQDIKITSLRIYSNDGSILFTEPYEAVEYDIESQHIVIGKNDAYVDISANNYLNLSAIIRLNNLDLRVPEILKDGRDCPSTICSDFTYSKGNARFVVTGWSQYYLNDTQPLIPEIYKPLESSGAGIGKIIEYLGQALLLFVLPLMLVIGVLAFIRAIMKGIITIKKY